MIADDLQRRVAGGRVERSARLRWRDGEARLRIDVPEELAADARDASPLLPACLLQAMRRHEDLSIEGPVDSRLLAAAPLAQAAMHAWDLSIRHATVNVAPGAPPRGGGRQLGSFFSRGVDSIHAALLARARGEAPLLVFCERLDPIQGERAVRDERDRVREAAGELGLPFAFVSTNLRTITDPLLNWGDMHGGGLGFMALSLAGGVRSMTIGSTHPPHSPAPWGSSPYLDPLWSTESVEVLHSPLATRPEKLALIAERAPALLKLIKVCFREDSAGNCGRCGKCLLTMAGLESRGLLDATPAFPVPIDTRLVAAQRPTNLGTRLFWVDVYLDLSPDRRHRALRRAIERLLRRTARQRHPTPDPASFAGHRLNLARSLLLEGEPYP